HLGGEYERPGAALIGIVRDVERLDAKWIACDDQRPLMDMPERESEHAPQCLDGLRSIDAQGPQHDCGVTGRLETVTGDTAVMLRALSVDGSQAVKTLRGMFAFAFWHVHERSLVVARDPLGIKPLYIAHNPDQRGTWSLVFASEVRAILASGLLGKPTLNPLAAASVIWNGFMVAPQ